MTVATRISRLFKADLHEILDCIEDPEAMARQALRDMAEEIGKDEELLERLDRESTDRAGEKKQAQQILEETAAQINASFGAGEENLAKTFLKRKLKTLKRLGELERILERLEAERNKCEVRRKERREKLAAMTERLALYEAARREHERSAKTGLERIIEAAEGISDEDVEIAFIQEKERRAAAGEKA